MLRLGKGDPLFNVKGSANQLCPAQLFCGKGCQPFAGLPQLSIGFTKVSNHVVCDNYTPTKTIYQFLIPYTFACSTFEVCKKHFKFWVTPYGLLCRN